jgi:ribosome-binding protein aMBF1 (putative translation factor)
MITGAQIRAARALLNWSSAVLAKRSGLHQKIVRACQAVDGAPDAEKAHLEAITAALLRLKTALARSSK